MHLLSLSLIALFLQLPGFVNPPSSPNGFRLHGRIVVDGGEMPLINLALKTDNGSIAKTVQSYANGTFVINDVGLGRYSLEVVDSRFNIATVDLWLRDPEDTAAEIVVRLARNVSAEANRPGGAEAVDLTSLERDGTIPASALAEFKSGLEATMRRTRQDPPELHFKKAIALAPEFYEAYVQLALELSRLRRPAEAIPVAEKAAALKPSVPRSNSLLGRIYVEGGEFQKGADSFLKLGSAGPLTAEDRYFLGLAFYRLDRPAAAQQQFEQAIALAPNANPGAYVQLHNAYVLNGDPVAALKALEEYLRRFPNDPNHKVIEDSAKKLRASIQKPNR